MDQRLQRTQPELADFLRRRRESLAPQALGLPPGTHRRTPGLRREEVATLAGVGLSWYTWLEQGRSIQVSARVLGRIAGVLQLDPIERQHLFLLAHQTTPPPAPPRRALPGFLRRLLAGLEPCPAHVVDLGWQVRGWNRASDALFGFARRAPAARNLLRMLFTDAELSARLPDWPTQAAEVVAGFRRDLARAPERAGMQALVDDLLAASPHFAALWRRHDVHACRHGCKRFALPGQPVQRFEHATFVLDEDPTLRLVIYQPAAAAVTAASR